MFSRFTKPILAGLLCATVLLAPTSVQASDIADGAGFFSAEAVTKANQSIHELEKKSGFEIRIETYATVPKDKVDAVAKMEAKDRETFFSNWLHDRADATKVKGMMILVCKHPHHLRIFADKRLQNAGFGASQAKSIRDPLLAGFNAGQFDKALGDTMTHVTTVFDGLHAAHSNAVAPVPGQTTPHKTQQAHPVPVHHDQAPRHAAGYGGFLFVIAIVIGAIVVISLISRLFRGSAGGYGPNGMGPGPGPGYGGGYGGGGGGFMSSLAGGIFGAVAGNWMYDQFSGRHAHGGEAGMGSDSSSAGNLGDSGSTGSDDSYSGGTDFGGGDFGGGGGGGGDDFGGGDFGGGGD